MQKITPCLWFDGRLDEVAAFYTAVFKNARIVSMSPVMASFEIEGQTFLAINGGPKYTFNEAVSFVIQCGGQDEVDYYWNALTADGGQESRCAWLKDKFGVSWQVVPDALVRYLGDPDRAKADRVTQAMLKMNKIVIADLDAAAAG